MIHPGCQPSPIPFSFPRLPACRLAHCEAGLRAGLHEASQRAAAAEAAAAKARRHAEQLAEEAQDLRDAIK